LKVDLVLGHDADGACPEDVTNAEAGLAPQTARPSQSRVEPDILLVPSAPTSKRAAYPPAAEVPTQEGPFGIRYDFNQGARIRLPERADGEWLVRLSDLDTGNVLFETRTMGASVASSKKFYIRFRLEVFDRDRLVFEHDHDCRDREVLIQFPVGTLGDTLAWLPYADRFQRATGCRLTCAMSELIIPLVRENYPGVCFVTHEEAVEQEIAGRAYATYSMGLFFDDKDCLWQPTDFRMVGLHRTAAYILGVGPDRKPAADLGE
jgi:autotransporter strand-loop-strand O-heptosyltransferase